MNYAQQSWQAIRRGIFPAVQGQWERDLKIAFLQGLNTGASLVVQSTTLSDDGMSKFNKDMQEDIREGLAELGHVPGKVKLSNSSSPIHVRAKLNGEEV